MYMYIYMYVYICMYMYVYVCICICMYETYINHPLSFSDISFFQQKSATLVISTNTDIDWILIHNC